MVQSKVSQKEILKAYKSYFLEKGKAPKTLKKIAKRLEINITSIWKYFENVEEIELTLLLKYFKKAIKSVHQEKNAHAYSSEEKYMAFLFACTELYEKDLLFLPHFIKEKRRDLNFWKKMNTLLFKLDWKIYFLNALPIPKVEKIEGKAKKSVMVNHTLSVLFFWAKDHSKEKNDTDAFIETSCQVLFAFQNTQLVQAAFGFGKFMLSRHNFFEKMPFK